MKRLSYFGFILSSFLLLSCGKDQQGQQQGMGPAPYPVIEVPSQDITGYTSYPVSLEGTVNAAVRGKVSGYITDVLVDAGEKVKKGQLLFKLETRSLSQEADAAQANVNAAQVEVNKLEPLVEKEIISPVQLETAKARLAQAKAGYSGVTANISYANITSPVNGYVGKINFREGNLISPADPTPLTIVSDIDKVYAFFSMNELDYLNFIQNAEGETMQEKIANFPPVKLQLINGQEYEQEGKIETISGQVDPSTGTVSFRASFPNPNRLLSSGNSGTILIPKHYENVPLVPEASTFEQQGMVHVYAVQGDTVAISKVIRVLDRINNVIVVESGIEPGDKVVAQGVGVLRNGTPIQPQPVSFDSIANSIQPVFK